MRGWLRHPMAQCWPCPPHLHFVCVAPGIGKRQWVVDSVSGCQGAQAAFLPCTPPIPTRIYSPAQGLESPMGLSIQDQASCPCFPLSHSQHLSEVPFSLGLLPPPPCPVLYLIGARGWWVTGGQGWCSQTCCDFGDAERSSSGLISLLGQLPSLPQPAKHHRPTLSATILCARVLLRSLLLGLRLKVYV